MTLKRFTIFIGTLFFFAFIPKDEPEKSSLKFTAYVASEYVTVQWLANPRGEIKTYELERSRDGKTFEVFSTVNDKGSSPESLEFLEIDGAPYPGWSYYRIKITQDNGKEVVTHSVPLFYGMKRMIKGEPMPVGPSNGSPTVQKKYANIEGKEAILVLRNAEGKEYFFEAVVNLQENSLTSKSTEQVPPGNYFVTASNIDALVGLKLKVD